MFIPTSFRLESKLSPKDLLNFLGAYIETNLLVVVSLSPVIKIASSELNTFWAYEFTIHFWISADTFAPLPKVLTTICVVCWVYSFPSSIIWTSTISPLKTVAFNLENFPSPSTINSGSETYPEPGSNIMTSTILPSVTLAPSNAPDPLDRVIDGCLSKLNISAP